MNFYAKISLVYLLIALVFMFIDADKVPFALIMALITILHADIDKLKDRLK